MMSEEKIFDKCPVCKKGNFVEVDNIMFEIGKHVFILKGHKCNKCKEEFPYEEETQKTITTARKRGIWQNKFLDYAQRPAMKKLWGNKKDAAWGDI